jgi:hypothetical protein
VCDSARRAANSGSACESYEILCMTRALLASEAQINTRAACIRPLGDMFALFTTIFIYLHVLLCSALAGSIFAALHDKFAALSRITVLYLMGENVFLLREC